MRGDDSALSRRDFIERTAYAAGLAGVAGVPFELILAEEAEAKHKRNKLPSPRNVPIDHFVILMMENRSFDHYFGWLHGQADGSQQQTYLDPNGNPVATRHHTALAATAGTTAARSWPVDSSPSAPATTSWRSPITTRASWASSTRRRRPTRSTTATSARCSPRPIPTATTSGRRSRAAGRTTRSPPPHRATSGRRSSTAPSPRA
jgi:hypothetical protein